MFNFRTLFREQNFCTPFSCFFTDFFLATFIRSEYPLKAWHWKMWRNDENEVRFLGTTSWWTGINFLKNITKNFISSKIETNELMLGWQSFEAEKIDQQRRNKMIENSHPPSGLCEVFLELFRNCGVDISFRLLPCDPTVL